MSCFCDWRTLLISGCTICASIKEVVGWLHEHFSNSVVTYMHSESFKGSSGSNNQTHIFFACLRTFSIILICLYCANCWLVAQNPIKFRTDMTVGTKLTNTLLFFTDCLWYWFVQRYIFRNQNKWIDLNLRTLVCKLIVSQLSIS